MIFKRSSQRYGRTPAPVTPYQRAAQVWDERIGSARVQARNWRLMAFGSLTIAVGLAGAFVDRLGEVQAIGPAVEPYSPTDAQIAWYLGRFIGDVRSLSIDPVLVRQNWLEAYDYATEHGAAILNDYARTNDPFKSIGERTVSVQVTSVVRVSEASFQVKWTEQSYDHSALTKTERWTAILTLVIRQPRTADALRKNPLGLYIDGIGWSRELNPGETP
jgi:type IV secretion system protein VirB5